MSEYEYYRDQHPARPCTARSSTTEIPPSYPLLQPAAQGLHQEQHVRRHLIPKITESTILYFFLDPSKQLIFGVGNIEHLGPAKTFSASKSSHPDLTSFSRTRTLVQIKRHLSATHTHPTTEIIPHRRALQREGISSNSIP